MIARATTLDLTPFRAAGFVRHGLRALQGPALGKPSPILIRSTTVTRDKKHFFELVDRLLRSHDPEEQKRIKEELARMTFGE
mgnify:CR=1 FL=1